MNLENQVTSFVTSKKLKKLGVDDQITSFYWCEFMFHSPELVFVEDYEYDFVTQTEGAWERFPAFTASELAEILTKLGYNRLPYFCNNPRELCWVYNFGDYPDYVSANTLVECLAEMIIYLKEKP